MPDPPTSPDAERSRDVHRRVSAIFRAAIERGPGERDAYVATECDGDETLLREVRSLLAADAAAETDAALNDGIGREILGETADVMPRSIGNYRVIRRIGSGGMGSVYEAQQSEPDRAVALKVLQLHGGPEALRRFRNEAQILGRLAHPNIAQIYESGTAQTRDGLLPFFAMELVTGIPLDAWARGHDRLEQLELMATIARAVEHAHLNGVVHRDLKPANILVTDDGTPKILDFGVAHVVDRDLLVTAVETQAGQLIGTLSFMAPEQIDGGTPLDGRCDVYALGVLLYLILARRLPLEIDTTSLADAAHRIAHVDPPRLGTIDRELRGDVETIVTRAMEKSPEHRYASAGALATDLERLLRHEPILARPATTIYQMRKFARRHPGLVAAVSAMITVLLIASVVSTSFAVRESRQRARADENFASVRALVRTFVDDFHDSIVDLPGSLEARKLLADKARVYLELLETEAGDDTDILLDVAHGFGTLADIQGQPNRPNIGDRPGALATYRRSIANLDRLLAIDPGHVGARRHIAIMHERLGNLAMAERDPESALDAYERSHAIKLALAEDTGEGRLDLSYSLNKLSRVYASIGRSEDALAAARESLQSRLELVEDARRVFESSPSSDDARRLLTQRRYEASTGDNRVGDLLLAADRPDEAMEHFRSALVTRRELSEQDPTNGRAKRDVAVSAYRVAMASERLGQFDEALRAYETVEDVMAWLVEVAPEDRTAQLDRAGVLSALGMLRSEHGDTTVAREELLACVRVLETLDEPSVAQLLADSLTQLADLDRRAGALDEATVWSRRSLTITQTLVDEAPPIDGPYRAHAHAHQVRGDIERAAGNQDAANDAYQAALVAYAEAAERGPVLDDDEEAIAALRALLSSE